MYLHRLELRAIGPYPDLVTIDFAALAASGVFLLEGPTGSGKSTIIDAVVFALYGGLAGTDASTDRLHSQHADPAVEPFVELVFETGAGVFRVRRTPQYDRPKQRGTGTVKQQASVQLFRLAAPDRRRRRTRVRPASPRSGSRSPGSSGSTARSSCRPWCCPRASSRRFLRSPGEDRRKLLQSLFGTQVYDRTADELAARRRAVAGRGRGRRRPRPRSPGPLRAGGRPRRGRRVRRPRHGRRRLRATADAAGAARAAAAAAATAATEHERSVDGPCGRPRAPSGAAAAAGCPRRRRPGGRAGTGLGRDGRACRPGRRGGRRPRRCEPCGPTTPPRQQPGCATSTRSAPSTHSRSPGAATR